MSRCCWPVWPLLVAAAVAAAGLEPDPVPEADPPAPPAVLVQAAERQVDGWLVLGMVAGALAAVPAAAGLLVFAVWVLVVWRREYDAAGHLVSGGWIQSVLGQPSQTGGTADQPKPRLAGTDTTEHRQDTWLVENSSQGDGVAVDGLVRELRQLLGADASLDEDQNIFEAGFVSRDAARLASAVTKRYVVEVRPDVVFEHNTLRKLGTWLAEQIAGKRLQEQEYMRFHPDDYRLVCQPTSQHSALRTWLALSLQFLGLASLPVIWALGLFPCCLLLGLTAEHVSKEAATLMYPLLAVPLMLSQIVIVVLLRRVAGRVAAGSYEVWSWRFIRWWYGQLLFRTVHAAVGPLLEDSIFMAYWLRLLGTEVGSGVKVSVGDGSCFELLSVGDNSSIGSSVYCHDVWNGLLHIRPVMIGASCSNGTGSVILPGTVMEDGADLMPNSSVCCTTLQAGEWIGTPPRPYEPMIGTSSPVVAKSAVMDAQDRPGCAAPVIDTRISVHDPVALISSSTVAVESVSYKTKEECIVSKAVSALPTQSVHGQDTVVGRLRQWCQLQPHKTLYTWLDSKGQEQSSWSYRELQMRANAVCHALLHQWSCKQGDRVALMYLPGLEFIAGFWGCLFAGVIAVPVYPVDLRGVKFELEVERFGRIVADCEAKLVLSHGEYLGMKRLYVVKNMFGSGSWPQGLEFEATDGLEPRADCGTGYEPGPEQLAFLQFTSGSTGDPKGVMLSHSNLTHNIAVIEAECGGCSDHTGVSWVPQYHDMGLIGVILTGTCAGGTAVLMSPVTMLVNPLVWLRACEKYKAWHTCGMDGMYAHAVKRISDEQAASLDLSSLRVYMSGGEPVRAAVVKGFADKFAAAGLNRGACYPCLGMAENAVYVTGRGVQLKEPCILELDKAAVEEGLVRVSEATGSSRTLVSCGVPGPGIGVKIVDAHTIAEAGPNRVGEIWVSGPSKAQGYWGKLELSQQIFRATIQHDPTGTEYLRTGDLGFIHEGELYVCGRLKDLIIVRGKNYYPQDIERTAEASHQLLKPGCSAAFSVEVAGDERLVLVAEVRGEPDEPTRQAVLEGLRAAVALEHGLEVQAALLLQERTVPKTTSGKIKRQACKQGFEDWAGLLPAGSKAEAAQLKEVDQYVSSAWELSDRRARARSGGSGQCRFVLRQLLQALGMVVLPCYLFALALPSMCILLYIPPSTVDSHLALLLFGVLVFLLWIVVQMVMLVLVQWLLIGRLRDGQQCHVHSWLVVRLWWMGLQLDLAQIITRKLEAVSLKTYYLQLVGAKISSRSRSAGGFPSSVSLIEIRDNTFVSGVSFCTSSSHDKDTLRFHTVSIGSHCDIALRSVVAGTVSDQSMVGSMVWIPEGQVVPSKQTALGTPANVFEMGFGSGEVPNLPQMPCWFSLIIYAWVLCGFPVLLFVALLPAYEVLWSYDRSTLQFIIGGCNRPEDPYVYGHEGAHDQKALSAHQCIDLVAQTIWSVFDPSDPAKTLERLVVYTCAFWLLLPALAVLEVLLKWCVVGRYQLRLHKLRATPLWTSLLRAAGSQIGSHTYSDSLQHLDFDLVSIGRNSCINAGSYVIGHVFQYGSLQFDEVSVGERCNVGCGAQVVPGVILNDKSSLCAVSRAFNGEVRSSFRLL